MLQEFHERPRQFARLKRLTSAVFAGVCVIFMGLAACTPAQENTRLDRKTLARAEAILDDIVQTELALSPQTASKLGLLDLAPPYANAHLDDHSQAGFERRRLIRLDLLALARNRPVMPTGHPLAQDLMILEDALFRLTQVQQIGHGRMSLSEVRPYVIDPYSGVWLEGPELLENDHYVSSPADALAYLQRLEALPNSIDDVRRRLLADAEAGLVPPAELMYETKHVIDQIIEKEPERLKRLSGIFTNILQSTSDLDPQEIEALSERGDTAVNDALLPAYRRLSDTLGDLMPSAPAQGGLWAQPNGHEAYARLVAWHVDGAPPLDALHDTNIDEADLLQASFESAVEGEFAPEEPADSELSFADYLARLSTPEPVDNAGMPIAAEATPAIVETVALEGYHYSPARLDGLRPALVIEHNDQAALWPDHMQSALFLIADLPRREPYVDIASQRGNAATALAAYPSFQAGWQMYTAESEAPEALSTPRDQLGLRQLLLLYSAMAAADTGLHEKRWSLDQSTEYLTQTAHLPLALAQEATLRIAARPGYATARLVSYRKFKALRNRARAVLGTRFDETAFQTIILSGGPRPFSMVERDVENWYQGMLPSTE